jgi:hypothetical protein
MNLEVRLFILALPSSLYRNSPSHSFSSTAPTKALLRHLPRLPPRHDQDPPLFPLRLLFQTLIAVRGALRARGSSREASRAHGTTKERGRWWWVQGLAGEQGALVEDRARQACKGLERETVSIVLFRPSLDVDDMLCSYSTQQPPICYLIPTPMTTLTLEPTPFLTPLSRLDPCRSFSSEPVVLHVPLTARKSLAPPVPTSIISYHVLSLSTQPFPAGLSDLSRPSLSL